MSDASSEQGRLSDTDAVGYGNPPKHSQFKKGQSGNTTGREIA